MKELKISNGFSSYTFLINKKNERLGINGETVTSHQAVMLNEEEIVVCVVEFTLPDKFIYGFVPVEYTYENREHYDKIIREMMNKLVEEAR